MMGVEPFSDFIQLEGTEKRRNLQCDSSRFGYQEGDSLYVLDVDADKVFHPVVTQSLPIRYDGKNFNYLGDWNLRHNMLVMSGRDDDGTDFDSNLYRFDASTLKPKGRAFPVSGMPWGDRYEASNESEGWVAFSYYNARKSGILFLERKSNRAFKDVTSNFLDIGNRAGEIFLKGRLYELANPLALKVVDKRALVLFGDTGWISLCSVNLETKKVSVIKRWTFSSGFGKALMCSESGHLMIPEPTGFAVWRVWNEKTPLKVCDIVIGSEGEYCVLLPDGKTYAGSPGCEDLVHLKAEDGVVGGHMLSPWRNRPADVAKALGAPASEVELLKKVTQRWLDRTGNQDALPEPRAADFPELSLAKEAPLWTDESILALDFSFRAGGSPLSSLSIRVNGVEQGDATQDVTKIAVSRSVCLAAGQNWVEAVAIDEKGRMSNKVRFRIICNKRKSDSKVFIVAVGVSHYREQSMNLEYASKDASDFASVLQQIYNKNSECLVLLDEEVTSAALARISHFLARATEDDKILMFCAGHGVLSKQNQYMYAGYDFDPRSAEQTGLGLDALLRTIDSTRAMNRLLLLDTCHSGLIGEKDEIRLAQTTSSLPTGVRAVSRRGLSASAFSGFRMDDYSLFVEDLFRLPSSLRGVNIIGASGGSEFALESEQWKNGVFTAALIEGLRDKKADFDEDGSIRVSELRDYLAERVGQLTRGSQKPSVVAFERDQNFSIVGGPDWSLKRCPDVLRGLELKSITAENRLSLGVPYEVEGVLISGVDEASAGFRAGLRRGDVIQKLDGKFVKEAKDIFSLASLPHLKREVSVEVSRDRRFLSVKVSEL